MSKLIVNIGDCKISTSRDDLIITHGLGSCIGLVFYDPTLGIGSMLHFMLPTGGDKIKEEGFQPYRFGDVGIQVMLNKLERLGCKRNNLKVVMVGGSAINTKEDKDFFAIGKRNIAIARKVFWKMKMMITKEHTGGNLSRSLYLDMSNGSVWFTSQGKRFDMIGGA